MLLFVGLGNPTPDPKSGIFLTKSGNNDIPIPKDKERAKINKFL